MRTNEPTDGISCGRRHPGVPPLAAAAVAVTAFAAVALAASLLSACSGGDETGEFPQETIPVGFSGNVSGTRAVTEYGSADDLTAIGVFTYFTNGTFSASSSTPNFMYNQKVERADNASPWTYSPVKYWPNNDADKLSFFAYAPYVDETASGGSNPTFKGRTETGFPTLTYTVPSSENSQMDLLASVPLMNQGHADNGGTVKFTMEHTLAKVNIYIKSKDKEADKKVTAFSMTSAKSGTLTYRAPASASDAGSGWSGITGTQTYTPTNTSVNIPENTTDRVLLGTFYLLPQGTGSTFTITYTYSGTVDNGDAPTHTVTLTDQPLPSLDKWAAGTSVSYDFTIGKSTITVTATTHPTWDNGGAGTVTGTFTITCPVNGPDNPEWTPGSSQEVEGTDETV